MPRPTHSQLIGRLQDVADTVSKLVDMLAEGDTPSEYDEDFWDDVRTLYERCEPLLPNLVGIEAGMDAHRRSAESRWLDCAAEIESDRAAYRRSAGY